MRSKKRSNRAPGKPRKTGSTKADRHHGACEAYPTKVRYHDHDSAVRARQHRGVEGLRAYECGGCGGWHLTSQPIEGDQ
jgi:hypothetical protein